MESLSIFAIVIAFVVGIVLGWTARTQENGHERITAELFVMLRGDLRQVKRSVEELRKEQRLLHERGCGLLQDTNCGKEQSEQQQESNCQSEWINAAREEELQ